MAALDLVIWSMALGAIAAVGLAWVAGLAVRPSRSQLLGATYHLLVFLFVLLLSDVPLTVWPGLDPAVIHVLRVVAGPLSVGLACIWMRDWLRASQRDRLMSSLLLAAAIVLPLLGAACLALPPGQQLPCAAAIATFGACLAVWLSVRAWLMGDRLAPIMAAGRLLILATIAGLYAMAMDLPGLGSGLQAVIATCAAVGNALIGLVLWRRESQEWRAREQESSPSQFDPVTKLHSGIGLVRRLLNAQRRRRRTRRDGAVIAILVFDTDQVAAQVGAVGLNEMFICIASRIQRQVGVVNPVGRYYDNCFVSLVETIHSPAWLRTLGLRVASSLRRPMEVNASDGQRAEIRADIGVGVVHLTPSHAPIEDVLHDAQRMAEAARRMRSRAAILDAATGEVVPVEQASLGPRRPGAAPSRHAGGPASRPIRT